MLIAVMRHRVRYFRQGVALGRAEFVEDVFKSRRGAFGVTRKTGARKLRVELVACSAECGRCGICVGEADERPMGGKPGLSRVIAEEI